MKKIILILMVIFSITAMAQPKEQITVSNPELKLPPPKPVYYSNVNAKRHNQLQVAVSGVHAIEQIDMVQKTDMEIKKLLHPLKTESLIRKDKTKKEYLMSYINVPCFAENLYYKQFEIKPTEINTDYLYRPKLHLNIIY